MSEPWLQWCSEIASLVCLRREDVCEMFWHKPEHEVERERDRLLLTAGWNWSDWFTHRTSGRKCAFLKQCLHYMSRNYNSPWIALLKCDLGWRAWVLWGEQKRMVLFSRAGSITGRLIWLVCPSMNNNAGRCEPQYLRNTFPRWSSWTCFSRTLICTPEKVTSRGRMTKKRDMLRCIIPLDCAYTCFMFLRATTLQRCCAAGRSCYSWKDIGTICNLSVTPWMVIIGPLELCR